VLLDPHRITKVTRLNITLRPSGGRGEYELAGSQNGIKPHDLYNLPIHLETIPGVAVDSVSNCVLSDGKPRIRLLKNARNAHPSSLVAASLLLPQPRRKRADATANQLLSWGGFVVQTIRVDIVDIGSVVTLRPATVRLENAANQLVDINYAERMARVVAIWAAAAKSHDAIDEAVLNHARAFGSSSSTHEAKLAALPEIREKLGSPDDDILPILEAHYHPGNTSTSGVQLSELITDEDYAETVTVSPQEARVERVRQWRLSVARGASTSAFRKNVRQAYDHRCFISGQRLPPVNKRTKAGVDAAHILPWCRYDLDKPENGLCLSKQCHWAFDEGILRLHYDCATGTYNVSIPNDFKTAARATAFDLPPLERFEGQVPAAHLPRDPSLWPNPSYLNELNQFLDGVSP